MNNKKFISYVSDHHVFISQDNFYTLEITQTTLDDSGIYSVTAKNSLGAVSCKCHLVVDKGIRAYIAPEFIATMDSQVSVCEGSELRLFAQVEAYPSVGITWYDMLLIHLLKENTVYISFKIA